VIYTATIDVSSRIASGCDKFQCQKIQTQISKAGAGTHIGQGHTHTFSNLLKPVRTAHVMEITGERPGTRPSCWCCGPPPLAPAP
jgi:hypothetical protein